MPTVRLRRERPGEAAALSAVGGFLDAYTFLAHGGVFANAQTGNVVLFGAQAATGEWSQALRHVPPILAFIAGLLTAEVLARPAARRRLRRPARVVLLVECLVFVAVGCLPAATPDVIATVAIAWAATLQIGTFRQAGDVSYNATFTTGNLRSLVSSAAAWAVERDADAVRRTRTLGAVVLSFAGGAVLGGVATRRWSTHAVVLVVPVLLLVLLSIAGHARRERDRESHATSPADGGRSHPPSLNAAEHAGPPPAG